VLTTYVRLNVANAAPGTSIIIGDARDSCLAFKGSAKFRPCGYNWQYTSAAFRSSFSDCLRVSLSLALSVRLSSLGYNAGSLPGLFLVMRSDTCAVYDQQR